MTQHALDQRSASPCGQVLHCVQREKPRIAMSIAQAVPTTHHSAHSRMLALIACPVLQVAIALHRPQPQNWPQVEKLLKWGGLRQAMQHAAPESIAGHELAMLTRLVKRMGHMDFLAATNRRIAA